MSIAITLTIHDHPQARELAEEVLAVLANLIESTEIEGVDVAVKAVDEIPLWPSP